MPEPLRDGQEAATPWLIPPPLAPHLEQNTFLVLAKPRQACCSHLLFLPFSLEATGQAASFLHPPRFAASSPT